MNKFESREVGNGRGLASVLGVAVGLVLSPIVGILVGALWYLVGSGYSATIVGVVAGIAFFVLVVWRGSGIFSHVIGAVLAFVPDPLRSCIEFGVVGALLSGGGMVGGIFLLCHTRPQGWDFDRVLPSMGLGAAAFLVVGLPIVISRMRRKRRGLG